MRKLNVILCLASFVFLSFTSEAKDRDALKIEPGPGTITAEEQAIEAAPEAGVEHAVILLEETERNESFRVTSQVRYHMRAKILSNEGRDLADITIPYSLEDAELESWWGRTLLPDGTVLELSQDELEEQFLAGSRTREVTVLKGTLPGVVPGAIIDFGYSFRTRGMLPIEPVPVQRDYKVLRFRYRWVPWDGLTSAFFILGARTVQVDTEQQNRAILAEAVNVPPTIDEPMAPPQSMTTRSLYFYYTKADKGVDEYWKSRAKSLHLATERFAGSARWRRKALEMMQIPADADLDTQLRAVYDWIESNLESTALQTAEQQEEATNKDEEGPRTVKELLEAGRGSASDLQLLLIALARELGAEAELVLAPDRTELPWVRHLMTTSQLKTAFVAVHLPGTPPDKLTFVDAGSTLPYGMVPWWSSGVTAMMATEGGDQAVQVPLSTAHENTSRTNGTLEFVEDNEVVKAHWTRTGQGQNGYLSKLRLRWRKPEKREEKLRGMCGESADFEIVEATAPTLETVAEDPVLSCTVDHLLPLGEESLETIRYRFDGPWLVPPPDLPAGERLLPIVFAYPRTDIAILTITAPEGYVATTAPAPINITSPLGSYQLTIVPTETGYQIVRGLSFQAFVIKPEGYQALQDHIAAVRKADRTELAFTRSTEEG